jgi:hypothetical protein
MHRVFWAQAAQAGEGLIAQGRSSWALRPIFVRNYYITPSGLGIANSPSVTPMTCEQVMGAKRNPGCSASDMQR